MKTKRFTNFNFKKETISKFEANTILGGGTQSNNQQTGCNTNCTASSHK
jgi:hypothetical protein